MPAYVLAFADGSTAAANVIVGADGVGSRVRRLVSDARPAYTGMLFIELHLDGVNARRPDVAALAGCGSLFPHGDGRGFVFHRAGPRLHGYAELTRWVTTPRARLDNNASSTRPGR